MWRSRDAAVVLALLLGVAGLAWSAMECMDPGADIASLKMCVEHAYDPMKHIDNHGILRSLVAKLDAAQEALDDDNRDLAIEHLRALVHELEAQAGKHIDSEHAQHMVTHAESVIAAL